MHLSVHILYNRKPIVIISLFLIFMSQTFMATAQDSPEEILYPWKSKSGLIGYSDQKGQLKIQPQFKDASLFTNEFAIIEKDGHKGVINKEGVIIIGCKYDEVQLAAVGNETLAITRKKYNAWWRINQWKLFPGFSIMGGARDKRFFDTEVQRMKWEITLLNNKQTFVSTDHRNGAYPYETSNIRHFKNKVLINDHLYQIDKRNIKHLSGLFKGFLIDSTLLRQQGDSYQIVDLDVKRQGEAIFNIPRVVNLKVGEDLKELNTVSRISGIEVKFDFMEDQQAHIYVYPDLKKIFPLQISKYLDDNTNASEIIGNAKMIWSVPETDYFLIYSIIHLQNGFYLLHKNGFWESDRTKTKDFVVTSNSGNLMYPTVHDLGMDPLLPQNFLVKRIERTRDHKHWFAVSGTTKSDSPSLSGIFDSAGKKWILPMTYGSLEQMKGYPYIWKFEFESQSDYKKKKYGLIDIKTGKIIIDPIYTTLTADGKAGIYNAGKWEWFYINPITGKEYRECNSKNQY